MRLDAVKVPSARLPGPTAQSSRDFYRVVWRRAQADSCGFRADFSVAAVACLGNARHIIDENLRFAFSTPIIDGKAASNV